MTLRELEATFLKYNPATGGHQVGVSFEEADGVMFLCPVCMANKEEAVKVGVHSIICWRPRIPVEVYPRPGRWEMHGSGLDDLTLDNWPQASSVWLNGPGCGAHFHVRGGKIC